MAKKIYINSHLLMSLDVNSHFHGVVRTEVELIRNLILENKNHYIFFDYYLDESYKVKYFEVEKDTISQKLNSFIYKKRAKNTFIRSIKKLFYKYLPFNLVKQINDAVNKLASPATQETPNKQPNSTYITDVEFEENSSVITFGGEFTQINLIEDLAQKHKFLNLKIYTLCYDLIPVLYPEYTDENVRKNFKKWLNLIANSSEVIFSISTNTQKDLKKYILENNLRLPKLEVLYLGDQIKFESDDSSDSSAKNDDYIIHVSTIEPRKNHITILKAYKYLIESKEKQIPMLYFIGSMGWNNEELLDYYNENSELKKYISFENNVNDSELIKYYKNCLFTIYPSIYEGWGLPVRESLSYGKFCLTSDSSSLPEAGAKFAEYIQPLDHIEWAKRIIFYYQNQTELANKSNMIVKNFKPYTWKDFTVSLMKSIV